MSTPDQDIASLVGSWRLLSHGTTYTDTKERLEIFGQKPDGRMVVTTGGRIMFLFMKPDRQPPKSDADRAALLNEMVAYSGTVRMDGPGRFITTIDLSGNPTWSGDQLRLFTVDGDRLTIRTPEQTFPLSGGRLMVSELIWEREPL
jgi:lipocalin-like protein